jgi:tRNA threonylcarbamoyladenosine biosynthesis protein TsaB
VCSSALHSNKGLEAYREKNVENSHSNILVPFIEELFQECGIHKKEIDAVAVSSGPGSYTGLRIGVSTAKGIAYSWAVPLIGIGTLDCMMEEVKLKQDARADFYLPMLDARRMEVYYKVFGSEGSEIKSTRPEIVERSFFDEFKNKEILIFGNGSKKVFDMFKHDTNIKKLHNIYPTARYMGKLAWSKYFNRDFEDTAYFEPLYLKPFMTKPSKKLI